MGQGTLFYIAVGVALIVLLLVGDAIWRRAHKEISQGGGGLGFVSSNSGLKAWLKSAPLLGFLIRIIRSRDVTLDSTTKLHYLPYLEHSNLASLGEGKTEPERAGYSRGRLMYIYKKTQLVKHAGERFQHVFHHKAERAPDTSAFRIFVLGGSAAMGHGAEVEDRYYTLLEKKLRRPYKVEVIPAGLSALCSTQSNVIFNLVVLPQKPDLVLVFDGWNDIALSSLFSVRPGDPMNISTLYRKYYHPFFNLVLALGAKSSFVEQRIVSALRKDRDEFIRHFLTNKDFAAQALQSVANVYLSNLENIVEGCRLRKVPVLHSFQPSSDLLLERFPGRFTEASKKSYFDRISHQAWANTGLGPFWERAYELLERGVRAKPWADSSVFTHETFSIDHFLDPVHLNPDGQAHLAQRLFELIDPILPALEKPASGWKV